MSRLSLNGLSGFSSAIVAGGLVLLLGIAALRNEAQLKTMQTREAARRELADTSSRLAVEIAHIHEKLVSVASNPPTGRQTLREAARALSTGPYLGWWSDGDRLDFVPASPGYLDPDEMLRHVESSSAPLLGPFTTSTGTEILVLQAPVAGRNTRERLGVSIGLDELWEISGLNDLIRSGMDVRVVDAAEHPIYWTSPSALDDPVSSALSLAGRFWSASAAPKDGWTDMSSISSNAVVVWLAAIAYACAYLLLARRPRVLEQELSRVRIHLSEKDAELSTLLRSRSQLETQLQSSLTIDLHTGLPNRTSFVEHLQAALARCRLESCPGTVVATVQFSKLEGVSHSMGSTVAEQVISEAADRLQRSIGAAAYLARTGEKELAVCTDAAAAPDLAVFADKILRAVDDRFDIGRRAVYSPACAGIATSADGYEHAPELLTKASLAAGTAAEGGERWSSFRPETKEERISMLQLEADLQRAIDNNEFRLHFQPIISVAEGNVVGLEALLRWRHPTESWIGPDRFIPLAESMGQMSRISEWVLRQAVAHAKQWLHLRDVPIYITVNLTPRDLNRDLCNLLFELLTTFDVPPGCIRVEVTETAVVRDFRVAARLIAELNERGIHVLLDDFGTGYSSLSYLRDLPFHAVKIDKSFVQRMTTEARDFGLVRSIVGLVHYLGMECVAEGIETQEQLDLIAMVNCNYGQGFFFSAPVPPSEIELLLDQGNGKPALARRPGS